MRTVGYASRIATDPDPDTSTRLVPPASLRGTCMPEPTRFGLFVPQGDTDPGVLRELAQTAERSGFHSLWVYDHLYNYPSPRAPGGARGVHADERAGGVDRAHPARHAGALRRLSQPGADGEDGGDARRAERRAPGARLRRRLARGGVPRLRLRVPARRDAHRDDGGGAGDHHGAVGRRAGDASTAATTASPTPICQPMPRAASASADHHRRRRREAAAARRGAPRRRLELLSRSRSPTTSASAPSCTSTARDIGRDPATLDQSLMVPLATAAWEKEVRDQLEAGAPARRHLGLRRPARPGHARHRRAAPARLPAPRRHLLHPGAARPDRPRASIEFVAREIVAELRD